jgi:nicotinamide-nucleotide amidase
MRLPSLAQGTLDFQLLPWLPSGHLSPATSLPPLATSACGLLARPLPIGYNIGWMNAEIIAVGSELLTPYRLDTNSLFLTEQLNQLGIRVMRKVVVGDDRTELHDAFHESLGRVGLVVAIGGLGPTEDDLTRETVAELLGRRLVLNEPILRGIEARFRRFGRTMPEVNARQAMVPEGAEVLPNARGTAPGLWLESDGRVVILLPGPPSELESLFTSEVRPRLAKRSPGLRLFTRDVRVTGMPESDVEQRIAPIYTQYADAETTILASPGEVQIHPRVWSSDEDAAEKLLDEMVERITLAIGENVFTTLGETLEEVVSGTLQMNHATIAVAESCTGGMLAERLTNVPGSSSYFRGGVVSYSNDLKTTWVGVAGELIEAKGAVSSEVAVAMADGIRRRAGSTLGLSVTGIAGPGGGTQEKPVGLVHLALADEKGAREHGVRFPGDRDRIRHQASQAALDMVRRYFLYATRAKG